VIAALAMRGLTIVLGMAGILWGISVAPVFLRASPLQEIASRIIREQAFKLETLLELAPALESVERQSFCEPASLRSAAIIRVRIAETTLAQADGGSSIDKRFAEARDTVHQALTCSPADSFLWLSLFWIEATSSGFRPELFDLLRMSYRQGPNEGWIIQKRNHMAIAMFSFLPQDIAELALEEYPKLLQPEFFVTAVNIFMGPGRSIQDKLLSRVANVPRSQRQRFAEILLERGVEVAIPGVVLQQRRWF
jgi:hypothetical protein